VLGSFASLEGHDSETRLEEQERKRFHESERVNLVVEERLFVPHRAHEKLFFFEDQGQRASQEVDGATKNVQLVCVARQVIVLSCTVRTDFDCLQTNLISLSS